MLSLVITTWTATAAYAAASAALWRGLRRPAPAGSSSGAMPRVSVVVAARDEERNLPALLGDLRAQSHPDFEVVVVDDRSSDGTAALVEAAAREQPGRFRLVRQREVPPGLSPKKLALQRGVEASRGEIVLLTDADCRVRPGWVEGMARAFAPEVGMVLGYSELETGPGSTLFERVQAFEFMTLVATMAATANLGFALGASGHNLAFRRRAFDLVGGYRSGMHRPAGDDMLMLSLVRETPGAGRVVFADDPGTRNRTRPEPSLRAFRNQRARWASSGMHHFRHHGRVLAWGAASMYMNLLLPTGPLYVALGWMGMGTWLAAVGLKLAADVLLFGSACRRFGRPALLRYLPLWFLAQPFYQLAVAWWGLRPRFVWKGVSVAPTPVAGGAGEG